MRKSSKAKALPIEILAILAILAIVGLAAIGLRSTTLNLQATFETVEPICLGSELGDTDVRAVGTSIIITTPIQTPNPCYTVDGEATRNGQDIEVNIRTAPREEICIQCVGVVTAKVTIPDLLAGTYRLKINAPDKSASTTITVGNP